MTSTSSSKTEEPYWDMDTIRSKLEEIDVQRQDLELKLQCVLDYTGVQRGQMAALLAETEYIDTNFKLGVLEEIIERLRQANKHYAQ